METTSSGENVEIYRASASFFEQSGLPHIEDPFICLYIQMPVLQWLQQLYMSEFLSKNDPYVKGQNKLVPSKVDGKLISKFPPKFIYDKYKSIDVHTVATFAHWFIWKNIPTR